MNLCELIKNIKKSWFFGKPSTEKVSKSVQIDGVELTPIDVAGPTGSYESIGVKLTMATGQTIPIFVGANLTWQNVEYDTGGFFDLSSPDRITIGQTGIYNIGTVLNWANGATGTYYANIIRVSDNKVIALDTVSIDNTEATILTNPTNSTAVNINATSGDQFFVSGNFLGSPITTRELTAFDLVPAFYCQRIG